MRFGAEVVLGPRQQRTTLAVLLLRAGSYVPIEELVDAVWDTSPPASAVNSLRIYVHRLRRLLDPDRAGGVIR